MIQLQQLTVGYGQRSLLENASATLANGELIALLGRNGSGKSTLLRTIAGLTHPISGSIAIDGHDIATLHPEAAARLVSLVTTECAQVPNLRCRDVVALGRAPYTNWIGRLQADDWALVDEALTLLDLSALAYTPIDRISDGECQRVMIARALAQDTPVILLDEPTSFLDLPNRYELGILLRRLAHERDKCVLFSTHELDIALSLCDSIALIDNPFLHHLPTSEMVTRKHIERLFRNDTVTFDPRTLRITIHDKQK